MVTILETNKETACFYKYSKDVFQSSVGMQWLNGSMIAQYTYVS